MTLQLYLIFEKEREFALDTFVKNKLCFDEDSCLIWTRFLPSATICADGHCCWSLHPAVRSSVRLSVAKAVTLITIERFQLSAWNLLGWCTVPWGRFNVCVLHGTLKFSMICFLTRSEGCRYRFKSLRISDIGLKFGEMMHRCVANFCVLHGTLKFSMICLLTRSEGCHYRFKSLRISTTGLKFGGVMRVWGTTLPLYLLRISAIGLEFVRWCTETWSRLLCKMAMIANFLCVPPNSKIG